MIEIKKTDDLITRRIKNKINEKRYKNQKEFCESFNPKLQESMLSDIFKGERRTIDNIKMIADKLETSLDYLVGINDNDTTSLDIKYILNKTGLTYDSYKTLSEWLMKNNRFRKIINDLLCDSLTAYQLIEDLDTFLSFLPIEEKKDDLRRIEKEEIYLKRLNKSLISFKYGLDETINSLELNLKDINSQLDKIEKKLKSDSMKKVAKGLNDNKKDITFSKKQLNEYFNLVNQRIELSERKIDIEIKTSIKGVMKNGKK